MLSINTNLSSLIIQNSLKTSTQKLNQAVERMSTGFKINHAKDNAAGYSIITDMNTKIGAYQIAEENTAMSLDLITTASDSLDLISNNLTRLRTLIEQSLNGTYAQNSKNSINKEANAIIDEIQRVYNSTQFNGIQLFQGKNEFIEDVLRIDTTGMTRIADLGEETFDVGEYSISTPEELIKFSEMWNDGRFAEECLFTLANNIDLGGYLTGEGWEPIRNFSGSFNGNGFIISNLYIDRPDEDGVGLFTSNNSYTRTSGVSIYNLGIENANVNGGNYVGILVGNDITASINNCYVTGAVRGNTYVGSIAGRCYYKPPVSNCYSNADVSGKENVAGILGSGTVSDSYFTGYTYGTNYMSAIVPGNPTNCQVYTTNTSDIPENNGLSAMKTRQDFQIGINGNKESKLNCSTGFSLRGIGILRNLGSLETGVYIDIIDQIIQNVNSKQIEYGTTQNRLESALDEISTQYENLVSSRSTLRDADISKTSAEYIKHQILQQASATLLAAAHQSPALALQLI